MGSQCCKKKSSDDEPKTIEDVHERVIVPEPTKKSEGNLVLIVVKDVEEIKEYHLPKVPDSNIIIKKVSRKDLKRIKASVKLQAWWRGTLVRRTLLHAALRAWIIQCWWRFTMERLLQRKRKEALILYAGAERAVVKLQSLIRMWRVYWRYNQVLNAIYFIQLHWRCHSCQTCAFLRGHCVVTDTHLQFHIEIVNP